MNINWFPGHMKKTVERLKESAKIVDCIVEILDARIPISSENPIINEIFEKKKVITVLNKSDLANEIVNQNWINYYKTNSKNAVLLDAQNQNSIKKLVDLIKSGKFDNKLSSRVRVMVVGIPNVGKSTFINSISKRKGTKTGNKPGITKSNQWIKTDYEIDLLDTPGVLWHKFESEDVGINLALTGAIKEEILNSEELACILVDKLVNIDANIIKNKYDIIIDNLLNYQILEEIGRKRGMLIKGGEIDFEKASTHLLNDFKNGKLGRISLESPR